MPAECRSQPHPPNLVTFAIYRWKHRIWLTLLQVCFTFFCDIDPLTSVKRPSYICKLVFIFKPLIYAELLNKSWGTSTPIIETGAPIFWGKNVKKIKIIIIIWLLNIDRVMGPWHRRSWNSFKYKTVVIYYVSKNKKIIFLEKIFPGAFYGQTNHGIEGNRPQQPIRKDVALQTNMAADGTCHHTEGSFCLFAS